MVVAPEPETTSSMSVLGELLSRLEPAAPGGPPLRLTGLPVPAPAGRVRIAAGDQVFEFDSAQVVAVVLADSDCGPTGSIEIELRPGAPLRGVCPMSPYRDLLRGRRPFALASRPDQPTVSSGERYYVAEQSYLARRGLAANP
jgi:hypothetical protein